MRQKGFAPIIILLVLVGIGLLAYFGYFYKPPETVFPLSSPSTPSTDNGDIIWKDGSISITSETEQGGKRIYSLNFSYPSDWVYTQVSLAEAHFNSRWDECEGKVLTFTSPNKNVLTMAPICGGWSAYYEALPTGYEIIDTKFNQGNDGHNSYIIRYTPNSGLRYDYYSVDVMNKIENGSKMSQGVLASYPQDDWFPVLVIPVFDVTKLKTNDILIADKIVKSLTLNRQ